MKNSQKNILILIFLIGFGPVIFCQESDFISKLKTQLLFYRSQKSDQSIVIQTDKTLYRPGETIWMKGYVADAITHLLSIKSLELEVQLTDNKGIKVSDGKYVLKNGVADFSFKIPADLPANVYYLLAWTPEMEAAGIESVFRREIIIGRPEHFDLVPRLDFPKLFFTPERKESANIRINDFAGKPVAGKKFEYQILYENHELLSGKGKTGSGGAGEIVFFTPPSGTGSPMLISLDLPVGNDRLNLITKIPLQSEKVNINFFPDGGKRVPGISQIIVYEAKDQSGNPLNITADILNGEEKVVTTTTTVQPGLGVISLNNNEDDRLKMRISSEIGKNQETELPSLSPGSMSISVKKSDGNHLSLLLGRSPKSEPANFKIVAVAKGELIWASDFELEQAGVIQVPLDNFHSELAEMAVFSDTGLLLAHRLIYTGKNESFTVKLQPDRITCKRGDNGLIHLKVTDSDGRPVKAELAVSLADRLAFPSSGFDVGLMNYGLEKPFPFSEPLGKVNRTVLDDFLATTHLKGFDWNQVIAVDPSRPLNFKMSSVRLSGKVLDNKNLPVPNALVSLASSSLQHFNARSDQHGEFVIRLPYSVDKNGLLASSTDGSGKGNYRVMLNKTFKDELINSLNNITASNWQILNQLDSSNYFRENSDFFKPVPMSKVRNSDKKTTEPYWKKYLDTSTNLLDILKTIRPYELMGGKIVFRGGNSFSYQDGALIVIDGQKVGTDASQLAAINPREVEDIQILLNPVDMLKYTGLNSVGIIEIKTQRGGTISQTSEISDNQKDNANRIFKATSIGNEKYDLKTTLQWIPVLFTNENGEAAIPFKAGGIKSTFILDLAGFTDRGQWIRTTTEIKVE